MERRQKEGLARNVKTDFMIALYIKQNIYLIATALTVAILFLAWLHHRRIKQKYLLQVSSLIKVIFSCLLTPEYPDNIYLFERRVHKQKIKCIRILKNKRVRAEASEFTHYLRLFEIILDIGQIRRRVTDHTIFEVCEKELILLQETMMALATVADNPQLQERKFADYAQAINQFEDVFEHAVKVAAREPVVFVLFIGGLRECQRLLHGRHRIESRAQEEIA